MSKDVVNLFVQKPSEARRHYPIIYVQLGALGDLCLTRVNKEIFDYATGQRDHQIDRVFMCDVIEKGESDEGEILFFSKLFEKCEAYRCLNQYFSQDFIREVAESVGTQSAPREGLLEDLIRKRLQNGILTELGRFLAEKYYATGKPAAREALFSSSVDDADWIFYMAISPSDYRGFIDSIAKYFGKQRDESNLGPAKIILLEKPFQLDLLAARDLAQHLSQLESRLGFQIYLVDHYAAKWALSQLPILVKTNPSLRKFIDEADEVVVELLEMQLTPEFRFPYMARTGLYYDMMPHALVPLQFLFAGKKVIGNARILAVGSYENYEEELEQWDQQERRHDGGKPLAPLRPETYFSLKLELEISDPEDKKGSEGKEISTVGRNSKKVDVYIRSGKGMVVDRKRVIVKRNPRSKRFDHSDDEGVGLFTIDIAREKFIPNQLSGVSLPSQATEKGAAKRRIRGYAKVIFDVMECLSNLRAGRSQEKMELISVTDACSVIENMEMIKKQLGDVFDDPKGYPRNDMLILDEDSEAIFLHPLSEKSRS